MQIQSQLKKAYSGIFSFEIIGSCSLLSLKNLTSAEINIEKRGVQNCLNESSKNKISKLQFFYCKFLNSFYSGFEYGLDL